MLFAFTYARAITRATGVRSNFFIFFPLFILLLLLEKKKNQITPRRYLREATIDYNNNDTRALSPPAMLRRGVRRDDECVLDDSRAVFLWRPIPTPLSSLYDCTDLLNRNTTADTVRINKCSENVPHENQMNCNRNRFCVPLVNSFPV